MYLDQRLNSTIMRIRISNSCASLRHSMDITNIKADIGSNKHPQSEYVRARLRVMNADDSNEEYRGEIGETIL